MGHSIKMRSKYSKVNIIHSWFRTLNNAYKTIKEEEKEKETRFIFKS